MRMKRAAYSTDSLTSIKDFSGDEEESAFKSIPLLSVWLFTPVILPFVISLFSQPIYQFRYTIGASPAFLLLVAAGIEGMRFKPLKMLLICAVILPSLANVWGYYKTPHRPQWREVGNYLNQNARSGDLILIIPKGGRIGGRKDKNSGMEDDHFAAPGHRGPVLTEVAFDYYLKRTDAAVKIFHVRTGKRRSGKDISELCSMVRGFNRVWAVLRRGVDGDGLIEETLNECHKLIYSKKYKGIEFYLFVRHG